MAQTTIQGSFLGANTVDGTKIALGSDATGDIMYYNGTDWIRSDNLNYSGTVLDVKSATNGTASGLKIYCDNNVSPHYILIKGGAHGDSTSYTLTLPPAAPTVSGQALTATTAGVGSWAQAGHTVTNTTANGVLTYHDATTFVTEPNLTFTGSVLALTGTMTISSTLVATGTVTTPSVLFKGSSNAVTMDVNNGVAAYSIILPDAAPAADRYLKTTSGSTSQLEWGTVTSSDTTYTHTWQDSSDDAILRLTAGGSGSGNDDLLIEAGTNITLTPSGDTLTITAAGGGTTVNGTTDNAILTYINSSSEFTAEANLVFDGNNLAIGQSSPVAPLQVHKETAVSSPYGTFAITSRDNLSGANGNFGMVWQQVNASNVVQTTRGSLYFSNTRNEMTMTGRSGNAFTIESTGGGILNLKNTSTDAGTGTSFIRFQGSGNTQNGYIGFGSSTGDFHVSNEYAGNMKMYTSGVVRLTIASNGTFSGSTSNDISDERIKENVENTTVGLAEILQLRPVKFNFQSGKGWGKEGQKFYGLLAQEVEAVIPEAVHTDDIDIDEVFEADIPRDINGERLLDENGQLIEGLKRDLNGVSDLKSVGMSQITTALIKAIQELKAEVDALKG